MLTPLVKEHLNSLEYLANESLKTNGLPPVAQELAIRFLKLHTELIELDKNQASFYDREQL